MLILNHIGQSSFSYFSGDVGHVRKLMETNFVSYVALATAALPLLKESEGSIVVVSSIAGELAGALPSACQGSLLRPLKRQSQDLRRAGTEGQHMI